MEVRVRWGSINYKCFAMNCMKCPYLQETLIWTFHDIPSKSFSIDPHCHEGLVWQSLVFVLVWILYAIPSKKILVN